MSDEYELLKFEGTTKSKRNLQSEVVVRDRRGRQRRTWGDDVKDWCRGVVVVEVTRMAEEQAFLKDIVVNLHL